MMYLVLFFVGTILVSLSPFLIKRLTKNKVFYKPVRIFVPIITVILFLMVASSLFMSEFNWYWRGYKTTVFLFIALNIFWIWNYVITTFNLKLYQIFVEIILFIVLVISTTICVYNLIDYNRDKLYSDKNYRIENLDGFMITADRLPHLIIKKGLFEKRKDLYYQNKNIGFHMSEVESCEVIEQENSYSVIFIMKDDLELKTSTINQETIEFNN